MKQRTDYGEMVTRMSLGEVPSTSVTTPMAADASGWLPTQLPGVFMALIAFTAPIAYFDPAGDLRRSGASTHLVDVRLGRRRRLITVAQAREIARHVMEEAERQRANERAEELRQNAVRWNEEDYS